MKKKVIGIFMAMVLVMAFVMINGAVAERIEGAVYDSCCSEVYDWLKEWVESAGDGRSCDSIDENDYYRGYGIIDGVEFEKEYDKECNIENIEKILTAQYEDLELSIVVAGFYDDYTVYKMTVTAKSDTNIGRCYSETHEDYVDYHEGDMYFMVVFEKD